MSDNPRIEELRRRVQKDPASIAFAQLAEEYRRAGSYDEAIETCRAGLSIHPGYLSARVTLGRALIEMNDLEAAEAELHYVLQHAPENLAAVRGLAEIHHRRGNLSKALDFYRAALGLARHDPDLEQAIEDISRAIAPSPAPAADGLSFEQASAEFLSALGHAPVPPVPVVDDLVAMPPAGLKASPTSDAMPGFSPTPDVGPGFSPAMPYTGPGESMSPVEDNLPVQPAAPGEDLPEVPQMSPVALEDPALPGLERFLEAIQMYRQRRAV